MSNKPAISLDGLFFFLMEVVGSLVVSPLHRSIEKKYAARRYEVCVGVGSLEVRAVGRKPKDAGPPPIFRIFFDLILKISPF